MEKDFQIIFYPNDVNITVDDSSLLTISLDIIEDRALILYWLDQILNLKALYE